MVGNCPVLMEEKVGQREVSDSLRTQQERGRTPGERGARVTMAVAMPGRMGVALSEGSWDRLGVALGEWDQTLMGVAKCVWGWIIMGVALPEGVQVGVALPGE